MASPLNLRIAEEARIKITKQQKENIRQMYDDLRKKIQKKIYIMPESKKISSNIKRTYLSILEEQLKSEMQKLDVELEKEINSNMYNVAQEVADANRDFLKNAGISEDTAFLGAFSHVPTNIVAMVSSGQLYQSNWTLSKAIWGNDMKLQSDIQKIIAQGITMNMSAYDIAKDIERYVDPSKEKTWEWNKVYPNTSKKVDYNAQRLARTMVSHAYQASFVATTKTNPWIERYRWHSAMIDGRTCELCKERDGQLFDKDKLPLDHPMGLCTFTAEMSKNMTEISNDILNWYNNPEGTYPAIDKYAEYLIRS